jgi:hypothetical protein
MERHASFSVATAALLSTLPSHRHSNPVHSKDHLTADALSPKEIFRKPTASFVRLFSEQKPLATPSWLPTCFARWPTSRRPGPHPGGRELCSRALATQKKCLGEKHGDVALTMGLLG